ncbi:MAG: TonB-dependent receptor [Pseudomonadota bacterium]
MTPFPLPQAALAALTATAFSCLAPSAALAQQGGKTPGQNVDMHKDHDKVEEIIVTAPFQRQQFDILQATSVLAGEALDRALETSIGETLARLPGIESSYFGPGVNRPVIRGLGGDRLRILIDGIGAIDASNVSPDHGVVGELVTAERVEVLRGPASLLYGSSAAGGVVNIIDGRIPSAMPAGAADGTLYGRYASNGDEASLAGSVNVGLGGKLALHADGFFRDTGDIRAPGFAFSPALRAARTQEAVAAGEDPPTFSRGRLDNTSTQSYGGTGGLSYVFDRGFLGAAVSTYQSNYGVPLEKEEATAPGVRIALDQWRVDMKGAVAFDGFFEEAKLRFGYGDYQHSELEGDAIGTTFLNQGWESRLELVQRAQAGHKGAIGLQVRRRDFSALGAEAFVPPNDTLQVGLFTLQDYQLAHWNLELSGRYERVTVKNTTLGESRAFNPVSVSAGLSHLWGETVRAGLALYRTERAPAAEELFSNGPHLATGAFEQGDSGLVEEVGLGGEATLRINTRHLTTDVALFYTRYDNFVFERFTGAQEDGLRVLQFSQTGARFLGAEVEMEAHLYETPGWQLRADATADFVRATDRTAGEPLPRIPPKSLTLGMNGESENWLGRVEVELAAKQARLSSFETETSGYAVVNADLTWRPMGERGGLALMLQGRNLNDTEARRHTSFLKDQLPLPGRSVRLAARFDF